MTNDWRAFICAFAAVTTTVFSALLITHGDLSFVGLTVPLGFQLMAAWFFCVAARAASR